MYRSLLYSRYFWFKYSSFAVNYHYRSLNYNFPLSLTILTLVLQLPTSHRVINSIIFPYLTKVNYMNESLKTLLRSNFEIFYVLGVQAYLAGLTFALAASPCSTPVLATLLGYVATSKVNCIKDKETMQLLKWFHHYVYRRKKSVFVWHKPDMCMYWEQLGQY